MSGLFNSTKLKNCNFFSLRDWKFIWNTLWAWGGDGIVFGDCLFVGVDDEAGSVPINFADHFTKLVSNKLVFPDSVFLRVCAARAPCSLKVVNRAGSRP